MNRLKTILVLVVMGGLALFIFVQYEVLAKLRAENNALRSQLDQLEQTQGEHESGSNSSAGNALNQEQLSELLKLRDEVTRLRGLTNELAGLRQQNDAWRASMKVASTNAPGQVARVKKTAADALPQDIHPKDSWAFRGYDTPDATIESMMWGMNKGDKVAFMGGFSPDMQARIEKDLGGKDIVEEAKSVKISEFRVLDRQVVSDDEMVLSVYTAHQQENGNTTTETEDTHFKKVGGQWRVLDKE